MRARVYCDHMNSGTQAREMSGIDAGVFLLPERFDQITKALGCESEAARSRLLDVDPKTIYRARRGAVGEDFIARAIAVMRHHSSELEAIGIRPSFEAMFEVRPKQRVAA
jgi:hypothetical protein